MSEFICRKRSGRCSCSVRSAVSVVRMSEVVKAFCRVLAVVNGSIFCRCERVAQWAELAAQVAKLTEELDEAKKKAVAVKAAHKFAGLLEKAREEARAMKSDRGGVLLA